MSLKQEQQPSPPRTPRKLPRGMVSHTQREGELPIPLQITSPLSVHWSSVSHSEVFLEILVHV